MSLDLTRGVKEIIGEDKLEEILKKENPIIKFGVDPTSPQMHLGHTVPLKILKRFQDAGYQVQLLIGDFTARVGDPSGKSSLRNMLTAEEVNENTRKYFEQATRVLNKEKTSIVYNNDWLSNLKLEDCIGLFAKGNINEMVKRRGISTRLEEGQTVSALEFIYPFLQGYDSVAMNADIEIGGPDQKFNFVFTRELQEQYGQNAEIVIMSSCLRGKDGSEKMSKSENNHISLSENPFEVYQGIMSCTDDVMKEYFELLTELPQEEIDIYFLKLQNGSIHPKSLKQILAKQVVKEYYSQEDADQSENKFNKEYVLKQQPEQIESITINTQEIDIGELLVQCQLTLSKSEGRRLIDQKAVKINNELIKDKFYKVRVEQPILIQVGKKKYKQVEYK